MVRSRDILLLGLAAMFLCVVEFSALAHLVLFLKVDWAYTAVAAGGLLALCQAAGAVGKPLSGLVSDRLLGGRRKAERSWRSPALPACACVILALISPGRGWMLWVALALLGVGAVGWGGLFGTLAGETAGPAAAGAAAGVTAAIDNVGIFIGPPLFGWIVDRTGSYSAAWWTMLGAAVLAAMLLALVREPRRAGTDEVRPPAPSPATARSRPPAERRPGECAGEAEGPGELPLPEPFTWLPSPWEGDGSCPVCPLGGLSGHHGRDVDEVLLEPERLVVEADRAADELAEEDHRDGLPVAALARDLGLAAVQVHLAERAGHGDGLGAARPGVADDARHEVVARCPAR